MQSRTPALRRVPPSLARFEVARGGCPPTKHWGFSVFYKRKALEIARMSFSEKDRGKTLPSKDLTQDRVTNAQLQNLRVGLVWFVGYPSVNRRKVAGSPRSRLLGGQTDQLVLENRDTESRERVSGVET